MASWFTSDLHWGHRNVIEYCNRPFRSSDGQPDVAWMHRNLKDNWNAVVGHTDVVYFLGDWCLAPKWYFMLKYLQFGMLYIILGNHDKESKLRKMMEPGGELEHLKHKIVIHKEMVTALGPDLKLFHLTHRPISGSDMHPVICGHVHERWTFLPAGSTIMETSRSKEARLQQGTSKVIKTPILNVGVDVHNFFPISEEAVLKYFDDNRKT